MRVELVLRNYLDDGNIGRSGVCAVFFRDFRCEIHGYRRCVNAAEASFHSVYGVGRNHDGRHAVPRDIAFEMFGDFENQVGRTAFDPVHCRPVTLSGGFEVQVARGIHFPGQPRRIAAVIVVHDRHVDVAHLHIGRPREEPHHHQRHHDQDAR